MVLPRGESPSTGSSASPCQGWRRGRRQSARWGWTAGKPCPPRAAAPSGSPPGMGAGLRTVDKLLAFKLESDSSLLARGAGNCAQEQVRRDPTPTRRRRMKSAGSTPPSRQPGCFPPDAFSFSLPLLFFHGGSKTHGVWPHRQRATSPRRNRTLRPMAAGEAVRDHEPTGVSASPRSPPSHGLARDRR